MNDAELVRKAAEAYRIVSADGDGADRLAALADRLETHALVPREPTEAMLTAIREAHWESCGCQFAPEDYCAAYRVMLTASEAK